MQLDLKQIKQILSERPTKRIWDTAAQDATKLQMHVLGHGLEKHIEKIDYYESNKGMQLRKKYCQTNRDLFARILQPKENIWNGRGGGTFYNTTEANEKRLRSMLLDVWNGYSLRKWMRSFWDPRYIDDPMGIIFMEVDQAQPNGAYPTYKASREIYEALPAGRRLEYVFFRTKDPSIFRLVDDAKDVMVKFEPGSDPKSGTVKLLGGKDYPQYINWFEKTPAMTISDIPRDGDTQMFMSPISNEIELADRFLREGSIANIYRFRQGFPRGWKYPEVCGACKGKKVVDAVECKECNGTGQKLEGSPADISVFSFPEKDQPEIKEKGGYISPDLDYLKYADQSLLALEELLTRTHWGTDREKHKDTGAETATGRFIDTQPVINRLTKYAECEETVEEFITNSIGYYTFVTAWKGAAVNLGRRFLIEPVDILWKKYEDARKNGAGQASLDDLLRDYLETKFQSNPQELSKAMQLMKLEPGVHLTMGEAKSNLPYGEFMKKVFFPDYLTTLTDIQIIGTPILKLKADLETFTTEKIDALPVDPLAPVIDPEQDPGNTKPKPKPKPKPGNKPVPA